MKIKFYVINFPKPTLKDLEQWKKIKIKLQPLQSNMSKEKTKEWLEKIASKIYTAK